MTLRLGSIAATSLLALALGAACSSDDTDSDNARGGAGSGGSATGGKTSPSAGSSAKAGNGSGGHGGNATSGSSGSGGASNPTAGKGGKSDVGGEGGSETVVAGAGGVSQQTGGQGGDDAASEGGNGGAGGSTEAALSCEERRSQLLGPIDTVSTGLLSVTSDAGAATITLEVDASAGGFVAAATNPYIYVSLANKAAVAVSDVAADTSLLWDLALKRDNIRSNGGDSGPGAAGIAVLTGVDFAAVTKASATGAAFGQDQFVDPVSCEAELDGFGKPQTRFADWYDYAPATNTLTPAAKVYLVRAANGTSLYKLQITDYYVQVDDGLGGHVTKSAVYSLKYEALP